MPQFFLNGKVCLIIDVFHGLRWEGSAKMHLNAQDSAKFITHYSINVIIVTVIITINITVSSCQWLFWSKDEAKGTVIPEKILKANPGSSSEMKMSLTF